MNIESRKLVDLRPAEYNPRKKLTPEDEEYQKIARSIEEFGYVDPIIINSDNTIIGGHQRVAVMIDKGFNEISVVVVDLPKEQEKSLNIALNKICGEWDMEKLKDILLELDSEDFDVTVTGFNADEIEDLIFQFHKYESLEDDNFDADEEYAQIEEPVSKRGDIWHLGIHRVMCGDSTNSEDVMQLMINDKAQLIVTDPPYNVDYEGKTKDALKIQNDNMPEESFCNFLYDAFHNMYSTAEPGAAIYVFHADSEGLNFRRAFEDAGFMLKQCLVWVKNALVLGRQDYQWRHEPILYGWKGGAAHYFIGNRSLTTVLEYNKPQRNAEHPTMKPIELLSELITNSSNPRWIVQDLFGGSGSTMIACEKLGRTSRLMEYDPVFVDVIVKRYIKYCKEKGQEPKVALVRDNAAKDFDIARFEK